MSHLSPTILLRCSDWDGPSTSGTGWVLPVECQAMAVARDPAVDAILLREQQEETNRRPQYKEMQVCC